MSLQDRRRAIYHLLNEDSPADAMAAYYAFYHDDRRTQLIPWSPDDTRKTGYMALSRTGIDLFRPFVTLRLPANDMGASVDMVYYALQPGMAIVLSVPDFYLPLMRALFDIQSEQQLKVLYLDRQRFEPLINVLVTQDVAANGLPRFLVHSTAGQQRGLVASAGLNWQSPGYAEIAVNTQPQQRRRGFGRSVVAAMVQHLLNNGRLPLYAVAADNEASFLLATSLGFVDRGIRETILYATLRPRP